MGGTRLRHVNPPQLTEQKGGMAEKAKAGQNKGYVAWPSLTQNPSRETVRASSCPSLPFRPHHLSRWRQCFLSLCNCTSCTFHILLVSICRSHFMQIMSACLSFVHLFCLAFTPKAYSQKGQSLSLPKEDFAIKADKAQPTFYGSAYTQYNEKQTKKISHIPHFWWRGSASANYVF